MNRIIAAIILLCILAPTNAQPQSAVATVNNYNIAQKRLLLVSTAQFINFITKDELDQDSVMLMACRITGMPFLILYNEGFAGKLSAAENLINAGKIQESAQLLKNLKGENRIQLLVELGIWYLHKTGSYRLDTVAIERRRPKQGLGKTVALHKDPNENEGKVFSGFIAQEVEKAAKESGYDFGGVDKPKNADDLYTLRYADFVAPLVKAVQEMNARVERMEKENEGLKRQLQAIKQ